MYQHESGCGLLDVDVPVNNLSVRRRSIVADEEARLLNALAAEIVDWRLLNGLGDCGILLLRLIPCIAELDQACAFAECSQSSQGTGTPD